MSRVKGSKNIPSRLRFYYQPAEATAGFIRQGADGVLCEILFDAGLTNVPRKIVNALNLAHKVARDKRTARAGQPTGGRKPRLYPEEQGI